MTCHVRLAINHFTVSQNETDVNEYCIGDGKASNIVRLCNFRSRHCQQL